MSALNFLTRLEFAVIRRLPFEVRAAYMLALGQVMQFPRQASWTFSEIFINETYRPMTALPPNPTIVDLGTNLGIFCMYINRLVSGGTIYCFEANPRLFPYLEKNIDKVPDRGNRFHLFNVAISDEDGFLDFTMDHENPASVASTAFLDTSSFPDAANYRPVRVPCARLDGVVPGRIDFLKCDIEGAEYGLLDDEMLTTRRIGQAIVEFHDLHNQADRFRHILETASRNGFALYASGSIEASTAQAICEAAARSGETAMVVGFGARDLGKGNPNG